MAVAVGEAVDLVLDRGAIARSRAPMAPVNSGERCRLARMTSWLRGIGAGDRAEHLGIPPRLARQRRHGPGLGVAKAALQPRPIDRAPIEPRRRPGLEPRHRQSRPRAAGRQPLRRGLADPPALDPLLTAEQGAAQERCRCTAPPPRRKRVPSASRRPQPCRLHAQRAASPAIRVRSPCRASRRCTAALNSLRSAWTRGPCTALPFERLSMR
jgi:hypothetical protein